jgi:hypothetical protein
VIYCSDVDNLVDGLNMTLANCTLSLFDCAPSAVTQFDNAADPTLSRIVLQFLKKIASPVFVYAEYGYLNADVFLSVFLRSKLNLRM